MFLAGKTALGETGDTGKLSLSLTQPPDYRLMMPKHSETRHLPYSPAQIYALVADVARYAEFLPWVTAVRVREDSDAEMVADLIVGFKAIRERFTSHIRKECPTSVHVDYLDGPLKYLYNDWHFKPDEQGGCTIDFSVDFAFKNRLFETLAGAVFEQAVRKMTAAFEARAHALYGD